ncbi:DUF4870 domain-containing protein [Demequina gelatinilytica]|uniref:DUF4870 domain-containing protein n=1 Tax=Demequina gelatinilytica TaxID=1638980 RepID=UPI000784BA7F|nr:DUF4870 domain-containing protein [Demequina gelatinilytica]
MNEQTAPQTPDGGTGQPSQQPTGGQAYDPAPPYAQTPPPYAPAPMLESDARTIAMLVHILAAIAMLLSAGTLAFVVPLVMWLLYRERSALIDHHGKTNLNLQLTSLAVIIGGCVIGFATLFIGFIVTGPLMVAYAVYALVISIVAGIRANRGEYYRIPLVIPFVR